MIKNLLLFSAVLACLSAAPLTANAGILEFLFPSLRDPDLGPSQTLRAPFADPVEGEAQTPGAIPQAALPENAIPLHQPHRNTLEISEWLTTAVSEAMTFDNNDYQQEIVEKAIYFGDEGKKQYLAFLQENNILKVLKSGKFRIRSFAQEMPLLLNEGPVDSRYRWLYEVPIMVSYMDKNMKGYEDAEPVNQAVSLTVQIGRSKDAQTDANIVIERWSAKVQKLSKK